MMTPKKNIRVSHSARASSLITIECGYVTRNTVAGFISRSSYVSSLQVVAVYLEISKTRHHAQERWQVQEIVERNGRGDRTAKQENDDFSRRASG